MASLSTLFVSTAIFGTFALFLCNRYITTNKLNLPPGPKRLPLVGNFFDLPKGYSWRHWSKYKELYGPISSLSVFGQHYIIINDQQCAMDLLERRSAIYSGRMNRHFMILSGWKDVTPYLQPSDDLLTHRKSMLQYVGNKKALKEHNVIQELESRRLISRILEKPDDNLCDQIATWAAAIILKVAYGYSVQTDKPDPLVNLIETALSYFQSCMREGVWVVDVLPVLRYIPDWFPGAYFKRFAKESRVYAQQLAERPFRFVQKQMDAGIDDGSYVSCFLKNPDLNINAIKWAAATLFIGGADTSIATLYTFFLAMTMHPEIQKKAQDEIAAVVGTDRLPTTSDRPNLPYVEAVTKEVIRWHSVVPLNIGHLAAQDDVYRGYSIPKGSTLLINMWFINHDPENHSDPFTFNPERFLQKDSNVLNPTDSSFGYGRRTCPGKEFADTSLFSVVSNCLATLQISKAKDKDGREIEPKYEVTDLLVSHPKPFHCSVTARSLKSKELIASAVKEGEYAVSFGDENNAQTFI